MHQGSKAQITVSPIPPCALLADWVALLEPGAWGAAPACLLEDFRAPEPHPCLQAPVAFPADSQRAKMHLINTECPVLQAGAARPRGGGKVWN